jgi:hydroxymethylglutaryl-CoA lyase
VPKERVLEITKELVEAGADEIAFNDTVGRATPNDVFELCSRASEMFPHQQFAGHFHDTNFTALANIYAAVTAGWHIFDSSAGGLGGCPFSPGASGNVATEKVVWMMENMGIATGIDHEKLNECAMFARNIETRSIATNG